MAGTGRAPKPQTQRRRRSTPLRGDWTAVPGIGWQHGAIPAPPDGLSETTLAAWRTWFGGWFAAHWTPDDLPGLGVLARLFDAVIRGDHVRAPELRMWLDAYGVSPKGQQDRRWTPPKAEPVPQQPDLILRFIK